MAELKRVICNRCESMTKPEKFTPGHILIEIALWLCFLLPGLLYSLWRFTNKRVVCTICGSHELIPLASPKGKRMLAQQQIERQLAHQQEKQTEGNQPASLEHLPA
jgi:RNase P subunit RPR2